MYGCIKIYSYGRAVIKIEANLKKKLCKSEMVKDSQVKDKKLK